MGFFDMLRKGVPSGKENKVGSSPSVYDIASKIAGLIDNTPLEMLTNKETRIILFKDSTSDVIDELNVCFAATNKFFSFKALAEVFFNTLENYETFIELRHHGIPGTILYTDLLAKEAARKLLNQVGLY